MLGGKKKKFGMLMARIGSTHSVRCKDGQTRMLQVKDRSRLKSLDGASALCLTCGKEDVDFDALAALHPEHAVMVKNKETHVCAIWVEDGLKDFASKCPDDFGATQKEIAAALRAYETSQFGLFSELAPPE
jgi:hypothetical protein